MCVAGCSRVAGRYGHAIRARIGFGRACEAAARHSHRLSHGRIYYLSPVVGGCYDSAYVGETDRGNWAGPCSPSHSQDAVFVLAYATAVPHMAPAQHQHITSTAPAPA